VSDIEELRISLHRIKQQIHIVGLYGLGRRTELVFGEGIDLVIASKDTPIFPYKQRAYEKVWLLEKTPRGYYSTDVFLHELTEILKSPKDGKTAKREQRKYFWICYVGRIRMPLTSSFGLYSSIFMGRLTFALRFSFRFAFTLGFTLGFTIGFTLGFTLGFTRNFTLGFIQSVTQLIKRTIGYYRRLMKRSIGLICRIVGRIFTKLFTFSSFIGNFILSTISPFCVRMIEGNP